MSLSVNNSRIVEIYNNPPKNEVKKKNVFSCVGAYSDALSTLRLTATCKSFSQPTFIKVFCADSEGEKVFFTLFKQALQRFCPRSSEIQENRIYTHLANFAQLDSSVFKCLGSGVTSLGLGNAQVACLTRDLKRLQERYPNLEKLLVSNGPHCSKKITDSEMNTIFNFRNLKELTIDFQGNSKDHTELEESVIGRKSETLKVIIENSKIKSKRILPGSKEVQTTHYILKPNDFGIFKGSLRNLNPHGFGVYNSLIRNAWQEGEFRNGVFKRGKYFIDNVIYEGNFKIVNGIVCLEGKGIKICANGDIYEGIFEKDKLQGEGVIRYKDGRVEAGEFDQDILKSKLKWKKGYYEGETQDGIPHGRGKYSYRENDSYDWAYQEGEFFKGELIEGSYLQYSERGHFVLSKGHFEDKEGERILIGKGTQIIKEGPYQDKVEGIFDKNGLNGMGKFYYENGFVANLFFKNSEPELNEIPRENLNETAAIYLPTYQRYIGEHLFQYKSLSGYDYNIPHGKGRLKWAVKNANGIINLRKDGIFDHSDFTNGKFWNKGVTYEGRFIFDELHGEGEKSFYHGEVHKGFFVHNELTGKGTKTFPNGKVEESTYRKGVSIFKKWEICWNKGIYVGDLKNGVPCGNGMLFNPTKMRWSIGGFDNGNFISGRYYDMAAKILWEGSFPKSNRNFVGQGIKYTFAQGEKAVGFEIVKSD